MGLENVIGKVKKLSKVWMTERVTLLKNDKKCQKYRGIHDVIWKAEVGQEKRVRFGEYYMKGEIK